MKISKVKRILEIFLLIRNSKNAYQSLNSTVGELVRTLWAAVNEITQTITDLCKSLCEGFNERILPSLKESYNVIETVLTELFDEIVSVATKLFEHLIESLKKFEKEFKQINQTISEAFQKVSKFSGEQFAVLQRELEDIYKLIVDHLKSLPGLDVVKEKYQEVNNSFSLKWTCDFSKMSINVFLSFCSCYSKFHTMVPKNSRNTRQRL